MPLYLIHGFKWDRISIIKHINYNHVSRASPSWIMPDRSSSALLASFRKLWPDIMTRLRHLYLFEEFDPSAEDQSLLDWAFVADEVVTLNALSVDLNSLPATNLTNGAVKGTLEALRDKLAEGEKIQWFIVYNGDPDRGVSSELGELNEGEGGDEFE